MNTHKHFEAGIELHSLSIIRYNRNKNGMRPNSKKGIPPPSTPQVQIAWFIPLIRRRREALPAPLACLAGTLHIFFYVFSLHQKENQAGHSSERAVEGQAKNKNQAQRRHYCEYIAAQEKCPMPHTTTGRPRALMLMALLGELPRLMGGEHS